MKVNKIGGNSITLECDDAEQCSLISDALNAMLLVTTALKRLPAGAQRPALELAIALLAPKLS